MLAGLINLMMALLRLLWFLLSTRVGNLLAAAGLLISGFLWGVTSHQVHFQDAPAIAWFQDYSSDEGYDYLQINHGQQFYVIKDADFSPYPGGVFADTRPRLLSLVYESDAQQSVELNLQNGERLTGSGYRVVAFSLVTEEGQPYTFTTADYRTSPRGFYDDHWPVATWLLLIGFAFLAWALLGPLVLDLLLLHRGRVPGEEPISTEKAYRLLGRQLSNPWLWRGPKKPREFDPRDLAK
ncbi:hypothetical protein [Thermogemmatispora tikiterensis]|uniref:Uncharacterized protein n=1 Tax=Thermogemmatispora tikiterensis TaxID=1825093 RepID=A0A328VNW8_9CHLR|nr:hypothetical protein [Thermogemmatispora tikiterensis]RAQ97480.1 hypothetical protein A4R35_18220 [Thermogemmatispora tikiterensis]